jgi:hypothetical protein
MLSLAEVVAFASHYCDNFSYRSSDADSENPRSEITPRTRLPCQRFRCHACTYPIGTQAADAGNWLQSENFRLLRQQPWVTESPAIAIGALCFEPDS